EIPLFDERDAQAAQRGVKGHAGPGYPAADDQNVEDFFGESRKRFAPGAPGKFNRIHSCIILIAGAFAVRRSLMPFFKSKHATLEQRFWHRGAESRRGREKKRLSASPPLRPSFSISLRLCVSVSLWLTLAAFVSPLAAQEAQDKEKQGKQNDIGTIRL